MNQRRIYTSFHDIPVQQTYSYGYGEKQPSFSFSRTEIMHILIAMGALTIAFAFALAPSPPFYNLEYVAANLPLAFLAIATAFFCHEMAHKYMGQKYGYWSEFRMFPQGLLLALFFGVFLGFVFAAPGAVQIYGQPTREESGKLAAAGPVTNLGIAAIGLLIWLNVAGLVGSIAFFIGYINTFLGIFNLLPFGPLDGRKIMSWNMGLWVGLLALGILLFATFFIQPF